MYFQIYTHLFTVNLFLMCRCLVWRFLILQTKRNCRVLQHLCDMIKNHYTTQCRTRSSRLNIIQLDLYGVKCLYKRIIWQSPTGCWRWSLVVYWEEKYAGFPSHFTLENPAAKAGIWFFEILRNTHFRANMNGHGWQNAWVKVFGGL